MEDTAVLVAGDLVALLAAGLLREHVEVVVVALDVVRGGFVGVRDDVPAGREEFVGEGLQHVLVDQLIPPPEHQDPLSRSY